MNEETKKPDAAQETAPTGKDAVILFIENNNPELKEATDEEKYRAAAEELEKNRIFHAKMEELFKADPMIGTLITSVMNDKKSLMQAMSEIISPEEYAEIMENEGSDIIENRKTRLKKLDDMEQKDAAIEAGVQQSLETTKKWLEAKTGWDDGKKEDFINKIITMMESMRDGVITESELNALENAFYAGEKIDAAREEGVIAGRNEQLDEKRLQKEAQAAGDGLPPIASGGGNAPEGERKPGYLDDVLAVEGARQQRMREGRKQTA
jgi:hypothetical protein